MAVAGVVAVAGVAVAFPRRRLVRVEVGGRSMAPALQPGDRVLVVRGLRPRPGDVVAVTDPRLRSRLLVKRVRAIGADRRLELVGDNAVASTDSRTFGSVPHTLVTGRVVWRYWPPHRRGRPIGAGSGRRTRLR